MKKLLTFILLFIAFNSFAQPEVASLSNYSFNTPLQAKDIYAAPLVAQYRNQKCVNGYTIAGNIFAGIGGALIGWPLGTALGGGEPMWELAAVGGGCIALAIPLVIVGKKRCNGGYAFSPALHTPYTQKRIPAQIGFTASGNKLGLQFDF